MIDEKEVAFMRKNPGYGGDHIGDLLDAIEALLKIAHAAQKIPRYCCAHDECLNYESDPECHKRLEVALKDLPPSDEGEKK